MSTKLIIQKNPFSNDKVVQFTDDKTITEIIKEIDVCRAVNTGWRILLNDRIISDYSITTHDGDTVYIKIVPESDWDNQDIGNAEKIGGGVLIAAGILVGVLSYGTLGWLGSGLIGAGVSMFFNGVVTYNTDIPNAKEREKPEQSPSIRGSRNQSRPLGYIPILLGKRRIYPDLIATPYTMIENGEQYFYQLFCCGQKNQTIDTSTLKIDETLLTEFSSSHNMNTILAGNDSLINLQIAYGASTPPLVTKCVHEDMLNATLKHELEDGSDGCIIRTTPDNTTEINVDIFFYNGIGQYNDDGEVIDRSVTVKAWYKQSQQDDTHYIALGHFASNDVITGHELKTKRYSISKSGLAAGSYTVKIERVTADADDSKIIDVCYVGSIRSIKNESPVSSSMCQKLTLIGLKVKASEKLNNYIEQLNCVSQANLPVYWGTGSGASRWSNSASCNPASAAMYAMQGEISQQKLTNAEIDWPAFERLYTWCNQHGYECNEYITDSMPISELLSSIGSTCRAEIFRQNGKITVIQDIERTGFVQIFTPRNSWGYEETIAKAEIPDALAVGFVDKTTGYAENELKIYNTPSGNPSGVPDTVQDLKLWGVTSSEQARKIGMYKYAVSRSRPILHKFSADFEYMLCSKGDWIKYAGDIALAGITQGRITAVITQNSQVIGVSCDEKLSLESDEQYAIRIRKSDGTAILKNIDNYDVTTNTVYFEIPETNTTIHEGDLFTFGTVGNDAIDLIITDIQCGENLSADIIAVEYAPQIFNVDSPDFVLPTFENKITDVPGTFDNGVLNIAEWNHYYTYYDGYNKPTIPSGDGTTNGWHTVQYEYSKWKSHKYAKNISLGNWSVPEPIINSKILDLLDSNSPHGTYTGQLGLYQSQFYKWNGTYWENISTVLPTDAVLHYSFDELPDLPDGTFVKKHDADWTSLDGWGVRTAGDFSLTVDNGKIHATRLDGTSSSAIWCNIGHQEGSLYKIRIRCNSSMTIRLQTHNNPEWHTYYESQHVAGDVIELSGVLKAMSNNWLYLFTSGGIEDYTIELLYVGDGSYATPVIDNSNGKYNAKLTDGLISDGISGKSVKFIGTGYVECDIPFNPDEKYDYSVSMWVKDWTKTSTCQLYNNWSNYAVATMFTRMDASTLGGEIRADICYQTGKVYRFTFRANMLSIQSGINDYHIVIVANGEASACYVNGEKCPVSSLSEANCNINRSKLYIGRVVQSSGYAYTKAIIDDFQIFDRALEEKEVIALYRNRAQTPKYFTLRDYQLNAIDNDLTIDHLVEKPQLLSRWKEIYNDINVSSSLPTTSISADGEYKAIIDKATDVGIAASQSDINAYIQASNALRSAFWGTNGILNDMQADSTVSSSTTLDDLFSAYQSALKNAQSAISNQQASRATSINVLQGNSFQLLPVDGTGTPTTGGYALTTNTLQVIEGDTPLTFTTASTLSNGQFKVSISSTHITAGSVSGSGTNKCNVSACSAFNNAYDYASVDYTISYKSSNGIAGSVYASQKISKSKAGANAVTYRLSCSPSFIAHRKDGTYSPSSVTFYYEKIDGSDTSHAQNMYLYKNTGDGWVKQGGFTTGTGQLTVSNITTDTKFALSTVDSADTSNFVDYLSVPVVEDGENATQYVISASMTKAYEGTLSWQFFVNGVLATTQCYADVKFSSAGGSWNASSLTGNFTGSRTAQFTGNVNGYAYKIDVYTDSAKTNLLCSTEVHCGAKGDKGDKGATGAQGTPAPRYLHKVTALPSNPQTGDFFVWAGNSSRTVGDVYQYTGSGWMHMSPNSDLYSDLYMQALSDIIDVAGNETAKFATILGKKLIAQQAVIDELQSKFIKTSNLLMTQDVNMPMVGVMQTITTGDNTVIDINTETAISIRNKLDVLLDCPESFIRREGDENSKRVYIHITSEDANNSKVNFHSKSEYYLERITRNMSIDYEIYNITGLGSAGYARKIISVSTETGTTTKYISSSFSNRLRFAYYAHELGINSPSAFFGGKFSSLKGYSFERIADNISTSSGDIYEWASIRLNGSNPTLCTFRFTNNNDWCVGVLVRINENQIKLTYGSSGEQYKILTKNSTSITNIYDIRV